jgi:hypothetical protein
MRAYRFWKLTYLVETATLARSASEKTSESTNAGHFQLVWYSNSSSRYCLIVPVFSNSALCHVILVNCKTSASDYLLRTHKQTHGDRVFGTPAGVASGQRG